MDNKFDKQGFARIKLRYYYDIDRVLEALNNKTYEERFLALDRAATIQKIFGVWFPTNSKVESSDFELSSEYSRQSKIDSWA